MAIKYKGRDICHVLYNGVEVDTVHYRGNTDGDIIHTKPITTRFLTTTSYIVPAGVTTIFVSGQGGGGSGGGGKGGESGDLSSTGEAGEGGKGGGAGSYFPVGGINPETDNGERAVASGETLTITIGAAPTGGPGGVGGSSDCGDHGDNGFNGGIGGEVSITGSLSGSLLTVAGGVAGLGGTIQDDAARPATGGQGSGSGGAGGSAGNATTPIGGAGTSGGSGGGGYGGEDGGGGCDNGGPGAQGGAGSTGWIEITTGGLCG